MLGIWMIISMYYYINFKENTVKIKMSLKLCVFWCGIPWLPVLCHFTAVDISYLGGVGFGFQVVVIKGYELKMQCIPRIIKMRGMPCFI